MPSSGIRQQYYTQMASISTEPCVSVAKTIPTASSVLVADSDWLCLVS